jgi:hypothetical protein
MVRQGKKPRRTPTPVGHRTATKAAKFDPLADMERAYRDGHKLAAHDAVTYCHDTHQPVPTWALETLAESSRQFATGEKPRKKMGRHASPDGRQRQILADAFCFELVEHFRESDYTWEKSYAAAAKEVNLSPEAVRKAYGRAKKMFKQQSYYLSYTYLKNEPSNW